MSVEEIKQKYNIKTDDLEEIKAELKNIIKRNHPDQTNDSSNPYITDMTAELGYIESLISNDKKQEISIPVNELVKAFTEIIQMPVRKDREQKEVLNEKFNESINNQLSISKRKFMVSRYSSASISAVLTFLWMFPNQILEHPLLKMLINEWDQGFFMLFFLIIWLYAVMFTCWLWGKYKRIENIEHELIRRIKLESVQNEIFTDFVNSIVPDYFFTKTKFIEYLKNKIDNMFDYKKYHIQEDVVQNMADIILLRAQEYEVIKKVKSNSLIDSFEIIINQEA